MLKSLHRIKNGYIFVPTNKLKHKIMNSKVIEMLAKQEVKWEAQFGRTITLEEAKIKIQKKLAKLEKENTYPY